jgi:hypothetical protein
MTAQRDFVVRNAESDFVRWVTHDGLRSTILRPGQWRLHILSKFLLNGQSKRNEISVWPPSFWMLRPEILSSTAAPNFFRLEREFARPFCAGEKNAPPQGPRKIGAETGFAPLRSSGGLPPPYAPIRWPKGSPVLDRDPHSQTQRSLPFVLPPHRSGLAF